MSNTGTEQNSTLFAHPPKPVSCSTQQGMLWHHGSTMRIFGKTISVKSMPILNTELGPDAMNFTPLSSHLSNEAMTEPDKVFDYLMENPDASIQIDGHTDAIKHCDQALSEARATSAATYLASKGIDASRIETAGSANNHPPLKEIRKRPKKRIVVSKFVYSKATSITYSSPAPPPEFPSSACSGGKALVKRLLSIAFM